MGAATVAFGTCVATMLVVGRSAGAGKVVIVGCHLCRVMPVLFSSLLTPRSARAINPHCHPAINNSKTVSMTMIATTTTTTRRRGAGDTMSWTTTNCHCHRQRQDNVNNSNDTDSDDAEDDDDSNDNDSNDNTDNNNKTTTTGHENNWT
ncbi:hypothetical protein EDB85DRAFT_1884936 [Lactarius pseudohatsudake]|nr:hypothetical protein EDB85DRAFT_1884936 [Lactarius pseudohatsudake]